MRVLSFIPAFLLAAISFVAAAPSPNSYASTHSSRAGGTSLQPYNDILTNATNVITTYQKQLVALGTSSPNVDAVGNILAGVTAVIDNTVVQVKAVNGVDVSAAVDLSSLLATIDALLDLVLAILSSVLAIVLALGSGVTSTLTTIINNLLNSVHGLVGSLGMFVNGTLSGVLGPVLSLLDYVISLLLAIVGAL